MAQNYLIQVLRSSERDVMSYSGRGMVGRECPGIRFDSDETAISVCLDLAGVAHGMIKPEDYVEFLSNELNQCRTDALGRGSVIYWPMYGWVNDEEDE